MIDSLPENWRYIVQKMVNEDETERIGMDDVLEYVGVVEQAKPMTETTIKRVSRNHQFELSHLPPYFNGAQEWPFEFGEEDDV